MARQYLYRRVGGPDADIDTPCQTVHVHMSQITLEDHFRDEIDVFRGSKSQLSFLDLFFFWTKERTG